jgi:hypothetical protein
VGTKTVDSDYLPVQPPSSPPFRQMKASDIDGYSQWFHHALPGRITALSALVRDTPGFEQWKPDLSPESLGRLGDWFAREVETRSRSRAEVEQIYANGPSWFRHVEVPPDELTDRTFSLASDVGMYLGEVLVRNLLGLRWDTVRTRKDEADYGQPVVAGFKKKLVCNPIRLLTVLAYGVAAGQYRGTRLRELYDTWAKLASD